MPFTVLIVTFFYHFKGEFFPLTAAHSLLSDSHLNMQENSTTGGMDPSHEKHKEETILIISKDLIRTLRWTNILLFAISDD